MKTTTDQFAFALAHIEKSVRIGILECAWLLAVTASPGLTYQELAEKYGVSRRDKPNGPGKRLRDKELMWSKYDVKGRFIHFPTENAVKIITEATNPTNQ